MLNVARPFDVGRSSIRLSTSPSGWSTVRKNSPQTLGEPNSWTIEESLARQGFGVGSNGFPGWSTPSMPGRFDRGSYAGYLDLEADVLENLTIGNWPGGMRIMKKSAIP